MEKEDSEQVKAPVVLDDYKAPIIDGSSDESDEEEANDYVVESVLDKKVEVGKGVKPDKTVYLVKWAGWERKEDQTWEPLEHLQDPDGETSSISGDWSY